MHLPVPRPHFRSHLFGAVSACLLAFSQPALAVRDAVVNQAAEQLQTKQAAAAFAALDPLEAERAGDVDFDWTLGRAALATGHYTRAVLALERAAANAPEQAEIQTDLARAYWAVRDTQSAKTALQHAQGQAPSTELAGTIDQFMLEIDRVDTRQAPKRFNHNAYIGFGFGHDSNATQGPSDALIALPGGGAIAPAVPAQGSNFYNLNAAYSGRYKLNAEWSWIGSANYALKNYLRSSVHDVDQQYAGLATGPSWRKDRHEFNFLLNYGQQWLGRSESAYSQGVVGSWVYRPDGFSQWNSYVQTNNNHYQNNAYANARRTVLGSTYSKMWRNGLFAFGGLYLGKEKPKSGQANLQHLGNDIYGLRAGLQYNWRSDLGIFANLQYEDRQFNEQHPTFLQTRHDKQSSLHLGLNWSPAPKWRISPSIYWQNSDSNLPLFQVKRRTLSLNARREF